MCHVIVVGITRARISRRRERERERRRDDAYARRRASLPHEGKARRGAASHAEARLSLATRPPRQPAAVRRAATRYGRLIMAATTLMGSRAAGQLTRRSFAAFTTKPRVLALLLSICAADAIYMLSLYKVAPIDRSIDRSVVVHRPPLRDAPPPGRRALILSSETRRRRRSGIAARTERDDRGRLAPGPATRLSSHHHSP